MTNFIGNIDKTNIPDIAGVISNALGSSATIISTIKVLSGEFIVGESVIFGLSVGNLIHIDLNNSVATIQVISGNFIVNNVIIGASSGATAIILGVGSNNPLDLLSLFPSGTPDNFDFASYVNSIDTTSFLLPSVENILQISNTYNSGGEVSIKYKDAPVSITNPYNPALSTPVYATDRYVQQHALEPNFPFKGEYPYVKSNRTESGHLLEIDDTPGHERILQQHKSGTYEEIHHNGERVMKIVGKNHHITMQDENIYIEGSAIVSVKGNITLRVGGTVVIQAEKGINMITPGDIRMKAKNIVMESTAGNIEMSSAVDIKATAISDMNISAKNNLLTSGLNTEISAGGRLDSIGTSGVSMASSADMNISSVTDLKTFAGGATSISSSGNFNGDASSVHWLEGSSAAPTIPKVSVAKTSLGTGITYSAIVEHMFMESDDDPVHFAQAAQSAVKSGLISASDLNASPIPTGSVDSGSSPKNLTLSYKTPTIENLSAYPVNLQLSPHFTLGRLSVGTPAGSHTVKAQFGLSEYQIVGNLQLLSLNILEKIYQKYPDMTVTSAFRSDNSTGSKISQHCKGQAADIQFASAQANPELYLTYAQWIRDHIGGFDQLLLEHNSFGNKPYWLHLSCNVDNPRGQILTLFNNKTFASGLQFIKS